MVIKKGYPSDTGNSKTAIGAEQTHPSNNAWYSDSDSSNSHGIEEPQMTQIILKTSSK
jgi:hypothetical protein